MRPTLLPGLFLLSATAGAAPQTQTLYTIDRPAGVLHDWTSTMVALPDLDGDGVQELALAGRTHGYGTTRVFSGADGTPLFDLSQSGLTLFYGRGTVGIDDRTGDGVPEIVVVGFHSGDSQSPPGHIHVYSGADGSPVDDWAIPSGINLREGRIVAVDDIDGDGAQDVLIHVSSLASVDVPNVLAFSTATGQPLYSGFGEGATTAIMPDPVLTSDHDGDGYRDFLVGVSQFAGRSVQVRSGRTGMVLGQYTGLGIDQLTSNGEPLVTLPDRDGDGLEEFAVGGVFSGFVVVYSTATGAPIQSWSCTGIPCLGSLLLDAGDLNDDGHSDLLTFENDILGGIDPAFVALDVETGDRIFTEATVEISPGYGMADMVTAIDGLSNEVETFVFFDSASDRISVRAVDWQLGSNYCSAAANSTGAGARISASGSRSLAANDLRLNSTGLPAGQPALFYYGDGQTEVGFGNGLRCVASGAAGIFRLPVRVVDAAGHLHYALDNQAPPGVAGTLTAGSTWYFQAWYRDPAAGGAAYNLSDGLEIVFEP